MANLADAFARLAAGPAVHMEPGEVVSVAAYGGRDGQPLVTVRWRGANTPAAYLDSYVPAVGHAVLLLLQDPQVVVLGRLIGTP